MSDTTAKRADGAAPPNPNQNPKSEIDELPFSTGWHCAHCDIDIRPPTPGLFSFNNPLGACPECRGFGRTIAIDLNKAIPDRSLSIAQGVVRVFRGEEFGESQKDLLRACAREEIDIRVPFEELPKADQNFVIDGEKRSDAARRTNMTTMIAGTACADFSAGSKARPTKCTCAFCSADIAPTRSVRSARRTFSARNAELQNSSVAAVSDRRPHHFGGQRPPLQLTLPEFDALSIAQARDLLHRHRDSA